MRYNETGLLDTVIGIVSRQLPDAWSVTLDPETVARRGKNIKGRALQSPRADALITISSSGGPARQFLVEVKAPRTSQAELLRQARRLRGLSRLPLLVVVEYASPALRSQLEAENLSYADAAGWLHLRDDSTGLFVRAAGSSRPALRAVAPGTGVTRLDGVATGRVMEWLLQSGSGDWPVGVRALATCSDTSPGTVSKLLSTLARVDALERDANGAVTEVRKRELLNVWTRDYSLTTSNKAVKYLLAPRGTDWLIKRIPSTPDLVLTSTFAAASYLKPGVLPVVPTTRITAYTLEAAAVENRLRLVDATEATANCVLIRPADLGISARSTRTRCGLSAPLARVLADTVTTAGRDTAVADQLMDQLQKDDPTWRQPS
jgi:hypothetical protein